MSLDLHQTETEIQQKYQHLCGHRFKGKESNRQLDNFRIERKFLQCIYLKPCPAFEAFVALMFSFVLFSVDILSVPDKHAQNLRLRVPARQWQ